MHDATLLWPILSFDTSLSRRRRFCAASPAHRTVTFQSISRYSNRVAKLDKVHFLRIESAFMTSEINYVVASPVCMK